jgi:hypothetical protein
MKTRVAWQNILQGDVIFRGWVGSEYKVPSLGVVWVGADDINEARNLGSSAQCSLMKISDEFSATDLWTIMRFHS